MDIMTRARLGRAILVTGARESVTAALPRQAAAAAAAATGCTRLLSGASAAAAARQQQSAVVASDRTSGPTGGDRRCVGVHAIETVGAV